MSDASASPANSTASSNKEGSKSYLQCYTCHEKEHVSIACQEWKKNLTVSKKEDLQPAYDDDKEEVEEIEIFPVKGEPWEFGRTRS